MDSIYLFLIEIKFYCFNVIRLEIYKNIILF